VHLARYYSNDKEKEDEMLKACRMHREEEFIQDFGGKARSKQTTRQMIMINGIRGI
jgi:hypothetical protein